MKQAKEQPAVSQPSSDDDNLSDLSDTENESARRNETLTENTSKLASSYCGSAVRGIIGKPYKLDVKTVGKTTPKSEGFNNTALERTPDDRAESQLCSKSLGKPDAFNTGTFSLTPKKETFSSLASANCNSKIKNSFSFLRQIKHNHRSAQNNNGFSDEDFSSGPAPRIVITDEEGHFKKIDELRKKEVVVCVRICETFSVVVLGMLVVMVAVIIWC